MQIQELATTLREEFINDKSLKKKEANSLTDIEIISYANSCHGCGEKHVTEKQLNKIVKPLCHTKTFLGYVILI
jgi:hypothetical protein